MLRRESPYVQTIMEKVMQKVERDKQKPPEARGCAEAVSWLALVGAFLNTAKALFPTPHPRPPKGHKPRWVMKHWAFMKKKKAALTLQNSCWGSLPDSLRWRRTTWPSTVEGDGILPASALTMWGPLFSFMFSLMWIMSRRLTSSRACTFKALSI